MEIIINTKHVEVSEHAKEYIEKKLFSSLRFIPEMLQKEEEDREEGGEKADRIILQVDLEKVKTKEGAFRAEVQVTLPGRKLIRVEDTAETLKESIDKVRHQLEREIKEYQEKRRDLARKGGQKAKEKRNI